MTKKSFIHYIQMLFQIHGFPIHVYSGGELIDQYEQAPCLVPHYDELIIDYLDSIRTNAAIYQAGSLILFGAVKDKKGRFAMMIGPVRAMLLESDTIEQVSRSRGVPTREMADYINSLPVIALGDFSKLLSGVHTAVNDEIITPDELYQGVVEWSLDTDIVKNVLSHEEALAFDELPHSDYYEVEQRLLYYVRNGMVQELKERWENIVPERLFTITSDYSVRNAKNHCILGLALITDAAIQAGVSPESAFKMRELYMKKTEQCTSLQQVMQLRSTIFCDFCERVSLIRFKKPDSPLIAQAVRYILENIANGVSLSKAAEQLHTGKTYLSTRFKEEMGVSFTDFVNMQKVEKSKELLLFTGKSIAEIAAYFSFSSQGYFQTVFRKFTGTTPNAFRKSKLARAAHAGGAAQG